MATTTVGTAVGVNLLANDDLAVAVKEAGTSITLADGTMVVFSGGSATVTLPASILETQFTYTAVDAQDNELTATVFVSVEREITPVITEADCGCSTCPVAPTVAPSAPADTDPDSSSAKPIRYADGILSHTAVDLASPTFGAGWGVVRQWSNHEAYAGSAGEFGNNVTVSQFPRLIETADGRVQVVTGGTASLTFTPAGGGAYTALGYGQQVLTYDPGTDTFTLTDPAGSTLTFAGFAGPTSALHGRVATIADAGGTTTTVVYTAAGLVDYADRTGTVDGVSVTERLDYEHEADGVNAGKVASVTLLRSTTGGATWVAVQAVEYTYYGTGDPNGNPGDLRTAETIDLFGGSDRLTDYYRYYTPGDANGYPGGLKYAVEGVMFDDLAGAVADPFTATDAAIAPFAGFYFEYDDSRRVALERVSGDGCSSCSGGQGEYTFAYSLNPNVGSDPGPNEWLTKTVETLPDGNTHTVFTNRYGQVMAKAYGETASGLEWVDVYRYDAAGRLVEHYAPSAVSGYDEATNDLVDVQAGNAVYLRDAAGLVMVYEYYGSTTATETTAGGAAGYSSQTALQRGELGADVVQTEWAYFARTAGGLTVYPMATRTAYTDTAGTVGLTTSYAYTWFAGTTRVASATVTLPAVSTANNGSGTGNASDVVYDVQGRATWTRDAAGFLTYRSYDPLTGSVVKTITDVDTTQTGDFADLPSGWATPTGGGLHLVTTYEVDALGRVTRMTDPEGRVDYTVYNDADDEVRYYPGWDAATGTTTGPITISRYDRAGGYSETLTLSATPAVSAGRPIGTEAITAADIESLSRTYANDAGQTTHSDAYFLVAGLTYATTGALGVEGTNFYRTRYEYDDRGRLDKTTTPSGTIYRTVFDGQGRAASAWVGTDDTPTTGFWSPTNLAGTDMVKTSEYEYDGGGVGDSNLTTMTSYPGLGAPARVTETFHDWRNRAVAVKAGVETTEATDVNRPIAYTEYDNLGRVVASEMYDGDGVTIADANSDGVPDRPTSSLLRAKSTAEYDELSRAFRTHVFSVSPTTGAVSADSLTSESWFDARGLTAKSSAPGGLVQKMTYDGAGRLTASYVSDGGGDTTYADALTVTGDTVLSQIEYDLRR